MSEEHHRSIAELISLHGRRAVVTGAARGIGLATARRLAEAGASVALLDNDAPTLKVSTEELTANGATAVPLIVELTDGSALASAFEAAVAQLGGLDIWVNNAGISYLPWRSPNEIGTKCLTLISRPHSTAPNWLPGT